MDTISRNPEPLFPVENTSLALEMFSSEILLILYTSLTIVLGKYILPFKFFKLNSIYRVQLVLNILNFE